MTTIQKGRIKQMTMEKVAKSKGLSLKEYRLMIAAKNPIKVVEHGKNIWGIKPYKD